MLDMGVNGVAYSKANMRAVDKYVKANYDRIEVKVPKGLKTQIELHAKQQDKSVNGFITALIRKDMGLTEEQWKRITDKEENE